MFYRLTSCRHLHDGTLRSKTDLVKRFMKFLLLVPHSNLSIHYMYIYVICYIYSQNKLSAIPKVFDNSCIKLAILVVKAIDGIIKYLKIYFI